MIDRPLVRITAPRGPVATVAQVAPAAAPRDPDALFAWLTDRQNLVLPRLEARIAATYTCGDAFAWADPLGPGLAAIQAAYHGAPYSVDPDALTGWAGTLFEDWVKKTPNLFLM